MLEPNNNRFVKQTYQKSLKEALFEGQVVQLSGGTNGRLNARSVEASSRGATPTTRPCLGVVYCDSLIGATTVSVVIAGETKIRVDPSSTSGYNTNAANLRYNVVVNPSGFIVEGSSPSTDMVVRKRNTIVTFYGADVYFDYGLRYARVFI